MYSEYNRDLLFFGFNWASIFLGSPRKTKRIQMKRVQLRSLRFNGMEEFYSKMVMDEEVAEERRHQAVQRLIEKIMKQADVRKPKPALRLRLRRFGVKVGRFVFMRFRAMKSMRKGLISQARFMISWVLPKGRELTSGFFNGYDGVINLPLMPKGRALTSGVYNGYDGEITLPLLDE